MGLTKRPPKGSHSVNHPSLGAEAKTVGITPNSFPFHTLAPIGDGRRFHFPNTSGIQPVLTSSIPVMTTSLGTHKSLPLAPQLPFCPLLQFQLPYKPEGYLETTGQSDLYRPLLRSRPWSPHQPSPPYGRQAPHDLAPTQTSSHVPAPT